MATLLTTVSRFSAGAAAVMLLLATPSLAQRGGAGPFAGLAGSWSGNGRIMLQNGGEERIRCRATYAVGAGGMSLQQNLRCASDSYSFDLTSTVSATESGAVTGTWSESSRGVSGSLSGRASGGEVQVRVDSPGFAAQLSTVTRGNRQNVMIQSSGTALTGATITLARGAG